MRNNLPWYPSSRRKLSSEKLQYIDIKKGETAPIQGLVTTIKRRFNFANKAEKRLHAEDSSRTLSLKTVQTKTSL